MIAEIAGCHVDQLPLLLRRVFNLNFCFLPVELSPQRGMNLVRNFALGATAATLARYTWTSVSGVEYPSSYTVCTTGNGTIYTVDQINPTAECISVKDGRLTAIGSRSESLSTYERYG